MIYEIATRGFTSPNGAESGTFRSLQEKLPYLEELGINGIWLTGHSLAHPDHFYNIWTQYAVIEPDVIDPVLGTEADFKAMIEEAHRRGIRIFLDVIIHGVMDGSPLIERHPDWFRGRSWGMTDFDFDARNPEFDNWWMDVWTRYIVEFGVDGYRIDLGMRRPDQWETIRERAGAAGKEIVIFNELDHERSKGFSEQSDLTDFPEKREFMKVIDFLQREPRTVLDPHHNLSEPLSGYGAAHKWTAEHWAEWLDRVLGNDPTYTQDMWAWSSVQLSCHDDGWQGFPGTDAYVAKGSRMIFGYGALFSGMIPIFMAGEEFNAPYRPLPNLSPDLFGGANPGKGTWLYGSWLDWDALEQPEHRAMFEDVKRLIAIRKAEGEALQATSNYEPPRMAAIPYQADAPCPPPYLRWGGGKAVAVVGNLSAEHDLSVTLRLPLDAAGLAGCGEYHVIDLWTGEGRTVSEGDLNGYTVSVPRDRAPGGGLRLLRIEPAS
jgi:glycosidase